MIEIAGQPKRPGRVKTPLRLRGEIITWKGTLESTNPDARRAAAIALRGQARSYRTIVISVGVVKALREALKREKDPQTAASIRRTLEKNYWKKT